MDFNEFEEIVKGIDKNKYHINRTAGMKDGKFQITEWNIFRKDVPNIEYFANNITVLSSKLGHTLEDIKKLIEEER